MSLPVKNVDLHGNVPHQCPVALLFIDVINDLEFPGGDRLAEHAEPMAQHLAALKERARVAGIPAIYINDNYGQWRSDFRTLVQHCREDDVRGRTLAQVLTPNDDDYFVLKPKHSGFYATALELLLRYLGTHTLILTGLTGDSCVLFTAADAFLRDYRLYVPADCTASTDAEANARALSYMQAQLDADVRSSHELDLEAVITTARTPPEA
jgi:nicotinamidase-related amidase